MPCCESEEMAALNCCGKIMYCGCDFCPEQVSCCCYPHLRLLNRAKGEFQSTGQLDQLSGDGSGIALAVREHAQLITPASFTLLGGIHLDMAGHLTATRNVEVRVPNSLTKDRMRIPLVDESEKVRD